MRCVKPRDGWLDMSPVAIAINGRFTGARATGVQRVAKSLVEAMDDCARTGEAGEFQAEVVVPRGQGDRLALSHIAQRELGQLHGHAWEQLELGADRRAANLVNLCNAAPLARESAATMIHDAQIYLCPTSYSPQFRHWYRFSLPRIAARSRKVLTVSQFSRRMLARFGVSAEEDTEVVYNGVDHVLQVRPSGQIVRTLGLDAGNYVLVFGSLQDHKNLRIVLEAFRSPALADLRLLIVGDADARAIQEKFAIPLAKGTVIAGRVTDGELRALLERAICILHPSTMEGFGLPPLEAMALGCPAIVSPAGALPEVCADAVLYADADDAQAWTDAICHLAFDSALRADMAARGRAQAAKFTWNASARQLYGILREVSV
jgi:glycosyltransferase involved in cell wall biosynthesis